MKTAIIIISIVFTFVFEPLIYAHDGHPDPVLQEINDYVMAIQLLRINDSAATNIFKTWQELRAESWEIRNLTDEQNLLMNSDAAMKQISKTRSKQKQLLSECRIYFAKLIEQEPAVKFIVDQSITAIWDAPPLEVQQGHFKVLLVEIQNKRNSKAELTMESDSSDDILFWNKQFTLEAKTSRYTFVVLAPLRESQITNTLNISDEPGNKTNVILSVKGIPMKEAPFVLTPDSIPTHVVVPDYVSVPVDKAITFSESVKFSITDKETGKPLSASRCTA